MNTGVIQEIAEELILSEGQEPEFMSIHEAIEDWAGLNDEDLSDDEVADLANRLEHLIQCADITITFPETN